MPGVHKYYPMSTRYQTGGGMIQYQNGGFTDYIRGNGPGIGQALGTFGSFLPENSGAGGFFSGAGSGAAAGSVFGPLGTGIGALAGGIAGIFGAKKRREEEEERRRKLQEAKTRYNTSVLSSQSDAILSDYESQGTGTMDFKHGGTMKKIPFPYQDQNMSTDNLVINPTTNVRPQSIYDTYFQMGGEVEDIIPQQVEGGSLNPISNDAVMVNGNSPRMTDDVSIDGGQTFVDHGEVLKSRPDGVDIFSDTLKPPGSKITFAKLAQKLEKQKNTKDDPRFTEANDRIEMKLNELFSMQQIMNGDSQGEPSNVPSIPGEQPGMGYDPSMNPGSNMFKAGGKVKSIYSSGGTKKFKYGGKLPAGRTQPSHGTFTPDWRRPSTATPAVNPHTTITTHTQSRKEPAVGMNLHKITTENNRPTTTSSSKLTQKKSKSKSYTGRPSEVIALMNRVGELETLIKSYNMGGNYKYQEGGEYYNEGMREAQMQVPYPGSLDYRKKKMIKGFEHGGMSDMIGNSAAHPFGRIGYTYGGQAMLDNVNISNMSYPPTGYTYGGTKKKSSYQLGGRNFNSIPTYGTEDYFNKLNSTLPMESGSRMYGTAPLGPPAPDPLSTVTLPQELANIPAKTIGVVSAPTSTPRLLPTTDRTPIGIENPGTAQVSIPETLSPIPSDITIPGGTGPADGNKGFNFNPGKLRDALNVGSMLGEYITNERRIDDIPEIPQPRLARTRTLARTNINDQLNEINRQGRTQQLAANQNTLPGQTQSLRGNILAKQISANNQAYGQKYRQDAQIANQEALLNTQIDASNLNKLQQFDRDQVARDNSVLQQRGQNFANLLTQARGLLGEASQKERDNLSMLLRAGADTTGSLEAMFKDNPELFKQYLPDLYKKLERKWGN